MATFYRADGWVKSTLGAAVSGAKIYICTQPANITTSPTPLASIFSDPNGLIPITQPIISDGFGHYNYYVAPGLYTEIIVFNGAVQQSYPDQSIGNVSAGGSGSSIVFETNSTPNFNQLLQNLVEGAGITVSTDNLGNTTIASSNPNPISMQVNSTPNADQTVLNFEDTTTVTWQNTSGGVVKATAVNAPLTSAYFVGGSFGYPVGVTGNFPALYNGSDKTIYGVEFVLPFGITVANITACFAGTQSGSSVICGIYNLSGNLLIDSGKFNGNTQITQSLAITPVTLAAGTYRFVWCTNSGTSANTPQRSFLLDEFTGNDNPGPVTTQTSVFNKNRTRYFSAANAYSGSALPSTLGALTKLFLAAAYVPMFLFEAV